MSVSRRYRSIRASDPPSDALMKLYHSMSGPSHPFLTDARRSGTAASPDHWDIYLVMAHDWNGKSREGLALGRLGFNRSLAEYFAGRLTFLIHKMDYVKAMRDAGRGDGQWVQRPVTPAEKDAIAAANYARFEAMLAAQRISVTRAEALINSQVHAWELAAPALRPWLEMILRTGDPEMLLHILRVARHHDTRPVAELERRRNARAQLLAETERRRALARIPGNPNPNLTLGQSPGNLRRIPGNPNPRLR